MTAEDDLVVSADAVAEKYGQGGNDSKLKTNSFADIYSQKTDLIALSSQTKGNNKILM